MVLLRIPETLCFNGTSSNIYLRFLVNSRNGCVESCFIYDLFFSVYFFYFSFNFMIQNLQVTLLSSLLQTYIIEKKLARDRRRNIRKKKKDIRLSCWSMEFFKNI